MNTRTKPVDAEVPRGDAAGFVRHLKPDLISGLLVFLIALPLCLGISLACGYPPLAGLFTAVVGALISTFISDSELTIKGPAAGLIVIAIGCVTDFGGDGAMGGFTALDMAAYRAALAVGVASATLQILFGLFRGGILGDFFPLAAVHGMLAAIGVIIMLKQLPMALGVEIGGEPLELLGELPHVIAQANPAIALIGVVSLLILFAWPALGRRISLLKTIPAPMVVVLVAIPMGGALDLMHSHRYVFAGAEHELGESFLVTMPDRMFGLFDFITTPDFSALTELKAWKWVLMFFMIGSLESLLSAKAVDLLDPWRRKTDLDRDMTAVGVGNLAASLIGGLPMISEIVRSKANIDNGARTRFADMWHGLFLLACVALIPSVLHRIPLAALAAMLVYTGYRLAHPTEFINVWRVGREQLTIFVVTLVAVLATDLMVGIGIGILTKMAIHLLNGVPLTSMFKPYLEVEPQDDGSCIIRAQQSAVFSNWIPFRKQLVDIGLVRRNNVLLDLSDTLVVDHSTMEKLHELQDDFAADGLDLSIRGLDSHQPAADHDFSARRRRRDAQRRLTLMVRDDAADRLEQLLEQHPTLDWSTLAVQGGATDEHRWRYELLLSASACEDLLDALKDPELVPALSSLCVERVELVAAVAGERPVPPS